MGLLGGGGRSAPPHLQRGGSFEEGFEGDFARDFLLRGGEDIFIALIIVIVIAIVIEIEKNNKQSKQGKGASETFKREKRSRQSEK